MARHLPTLFVTLAAVVFVLAILARYRGYVGERDFILQATVPCDPSADSCFVALCPEGAGADCLPGPYAKAMVSAQSAPACVEEHDCGDFSCDGREQCAISFCSGETLEPGERCTAPTAP